MPASISLLICLAPREMHPIHFYSVQTAKKQSNTSIGNKRTRQVLIIFLITNNRLVETTKLKMIIALLFSIGEEQMNQWSRNYRLFRSFGVQNNELNALKIIKNKGESCSESSFYCLGNHHEPDLHNKHNILNQKDS